MNKMNPACVGEKIDEFSITGRIFKVDQTE